MPLASAVPYNTVCTTEMRLRSLHCRANWAAEVQHSCQHVTQMKPGWPHHHGLAGHTLLRPGHTLLKLGHTMSHPPAQWSHLPAQWSHLPSCCGAWHTGLCLAAQVSMPMRPCWSHPSGWTGHTFLWPAHTPRVPSMVTPHHTFQPAVVLGTQVCTCLVVAGSGLMPAAPFLIASYRNHKPICVLKGEGGAGAGGGGSVSDV